ncbi:MAG: hypothetical protein ACO3I0_11720 [Limisphaerales bacterium]|jgi:hypothetical protein
MIPETPIRASLRVRPLFGRRILALVGAVTASLLHGATNLTRIPPPPTAPAPSAAPQPIRDIRGPIDIESPWTWLWAALALAAVTAGILLAWRWWQRKQESSTTGTPTLSPEEAARRRLQAALAWIGDPERFVVEVSEAARNYLEGRFGLRAPERTTEEFLAELTGSVALDGRHKELLADFLTRCDLVKFARAVVDRSELQALHQAAVRLVEETVPSPNGPAAPPAMPPRQR